MLENRMEDKKLDLDAPLLSVRRFSAVAPTSAPAVAKSGGNDRNPPPRRSSLPFYKSELKTGPVRNPGAIPFVWEQTPGQPKNGAVSTSSSSSSTAAPDGDVGKPLVASKPPPGRSSNYKDTGGDQSAGAAATAAPMVKSGSSVRTRKAVTFAPLNETTPKAIEITNSGSTQKVSVEKDKEKDQQPMPVTEHRRLNGDDDDDDEAFSDALDTLSRNESVFLNCSVSGISGIPDSARPSAVFSTDPQVRDFMMGRFLPAAQAMASSSPQYTFRKPAPAAHEPTKPARRVASGDYRKPPPGPLQQRLYNVSQYVTQQQVHDNRDDDDNDDEDEEDYEENGHLSSKACGLLPKLCLLNPLPAMKVRGRLSTPPRRRTGSPQVRSSQNGSLGQPEVEHSWEAVYRHKLGQGYRPEMEDGRSKLTSESNQLTYWSDSLTADGSSPYQHSAGGLSPFRNEAPPSPFHEGKGFLGVPSRESKSSKTDGSDGRLSSGSASPALEKTLFVDSLSVQETADSKSSSFSAVTFAKGMLNPGEKNAEVGIGRQRVEESLVVEALQPKAFDVVAHGLPFSLKRLSHGEANGDDNLKQNLSDNDILHFEAGDLTKSNVSALQSLLPPPLPKTPSESWLSRTLPSGTPRNPIPRSLLGIRFQPRKQATQMSSADLKLQTNAKPSKSRRHQIKFAEVLAKPEFPKSEI